MLGIYARHLPAPNNTADGYFGRQIQLIVSEDSSDQIIRGKKDGSAANPLN